MDPVEGTIKLNEDMEYIDEVNINSFIETYSVDTSISNSEADIIYVPTAYLDSKYKGIDIDWKINDSNETENITGKSPIEMKSDDFPNSVILDAVEYLNLPSSYGGCGPIASMGIVEYFANTFIYDELPDAKTYNSQFGIAKTVLGNITTYEVGDEDTFTFPWDYVSGFKKIMKQYDLENTIVASNQGILNTANLKINKIKEQINKGLPVTIYTLRAGDGNLSNHYFNVYGYVEYSGYDEDDNYYFETLLKIRPNFNITDTCYADSVLLSSFFTGVIYYDIVYDEKTLVPTDFFQFVNTNGDGQYFNYEVEQSIAIDDEFGFDTKRLRCSYIEDTYLVLSAIKKNGVAIENTMQEAYLEMDFSDYDNIHKLELDLSLWSTAEQFDLEERSIFRVEYCREGSTTWNYNEKHTVVVDYTTSLPTKESYQRFHYYFPYNDINKIRIYLANPTVDSYYNKGRVVINGINLCFDNHNTQIHHHQFDDSYEFYNEQFHKAYCECESFELLPHNETVDEQGNVVCNKCLYVIEVHEHSFNSSYSYIDTNTHLAYCGCGDTSIVNHKYDKNGSYINTTSHQVYCDCGDSIIEGHIYQNGTCKKCDYEHNHTLVYVSCDDGLHHFKSCSCGLSVRESCQGLVGIGGNARCKKCGQTIDSQIILKKNKLEEEDL